jgi:hypothetical protein
LKYESIGTQTGMVSRSPMAELMLYACASL